MPDLVDEVTDLLQHLIRNACVNDGSDESGQEVRSADVLTSYLEGSGLDLEVYESSPGRRSIAVRIEGSDPHAPSLMLMGHTDVVPANPDGWRHDPFGGEIADGFVWGRGAVDMLNLTTSMAVATRHLANSGFAPRGTLVYLAVADEEAGGKLGAKWLAETQPDTVRTDYVLTELGGAPLTLDPASGPRLPVAVAEKGAYWGTVRVRGVAGHGSMPLRTDNALVTGAEVVRRLAAFRPPPRMTEVWRRFVAGLDVPGEFAAQLLDVDGLDAACESLPDVGLARLIHACTHTTMVPTMMAAGLKTNIIPDHAVIDFDIRALPGLKEADVLEMIRAALGDLADVVETEIRTGDEANESPVDTPLWDVIARHSQRLVPNSKLVPYILPGATDSRFLRPLGATCYGFGAYSGRITFPEYAKMFHGDDERVDPESLRLSTELWMAVATDLLA